MTPRPSAGHGDEGNSRDIVDRDSNVDGNLDGNETSARGQNDARIADLAATAAETRTRLTTDPPISDRNSVSIDGQTVSDLEDAALIAARDGLGPVLATYVEARTGSDWVRFTDTEMQQLHGATSDWLAVYAACHGVDADPDVTVREAAEVLIDTHNVTDVADLLTGLHREHPR